MQARQFKSERRKVEERNNAGMDGFSILLFTCGGAVRSMDCTQNFGSGTLVIGRVGLIVSFEELDTVNVKSRMQ